MTIREALERRAGFRRRTRLRAGKLIDHEGTYLCDCLISDRSGPGARLGLPADIDLPSRLFLFEDDLAQVSEVRLVWRRALIAGVRYLDPPHGAVARAMRRRFAAKYYALDEPLKRR
jgi:hypothetical protein